MSFLSTEETELAESASRLWWLYLITGVLWLWVTLIILSLDIDSVYAIAILFGFVAIGAGINEFFAMGASTTGWRIAHGILGVLFIAAGIVAFFRPQGTFVALAAIVAWVLLFKGIFDIVLALRHAPRAPLVGRPHRRSRRDPPCLLGRRILPGQRDHPRRVGRSPDAPAWDHRDRDGVQAAPPQEGAHPGSVVAGAPRKPRRGSAPPAAAAP